MIKPNDTTICINNFFLFGNLTLKIEKNNSKNSGEERIIMPPNYAVDDNSGNMITNQQVKCFQKYKVKI